MQRKNYVRGLLLAASMGIAILASGARGSSYSEAAFMRTDAFERGRPVALGNLIRAKKLSLAQINRLIYLAATHKNATTVETLLSMRQGLDIAQALYGFADAGHVEDVGNILRRYKKSFSAKHKEHAVDRVFHQMQTCTRSCEGAPLRLQHKLISYRAIISILIEDGASQWEDMVNWTLQKANANAVLLQAIFAKAKKTLKEPSYLALMDFAVKAGSRPYSSAGLTLVKLAVAEGASSDAMGEALFDACYFHNARVVEHLLTKVDPGYESKTDESGDARYYLKIGFDFLGKEKKPYEALRLQQLNEAISNMLNRRRYSIPDGVGDLRKQDSVRSTATDELKAEAPSAVVRQRGTTVFSRAAKAALL